MRLARPFALVPWLALALLARVALGPESALPPFALGAAAEVSAAPSSCGSDECGCPHGAAPVSCCCAGERVSAAHPYAPPSFTALHEGRGPTLESLACSGARARVVARASEPLVALAPGPTRIETAPRAEWTPRSEPGPLFDLETEPPTPPPRARAS